MERLSAARAADWHELTALQAARRLTSDPSDGLDPAEARRRLERDGPNEILERKGKGPARILWEQFTATMILVLLGAAGLSAAAGDYRDAAAIGAIVVLNALLGFAHEHRAERAMSSLRRLGAPLARVRRGGAVRRIPAREVVAGDLLLLDAGTMIAADARLVECAALMTAEATLTGESEAIEKTVEPLAEAAALGDRRNMAYRGTSVVHGRGAALVTATGMDTEVGRIAALASAAGGEPTVLQRRLDGLGNRLAAAALGVVAVVFTLGLLRGERLREMFMTAVSLAAAAVPEGLPAVVTIALALGARRMLARRALIRTLTAVETLGAVTVICSDKTGTLTEGRMEVTGLEGPERALLAAVSLCNDSERGDGDPTELALASAAAREGLSRLELERSFPRVAEAPFDAARKRMSTVHRLSRPLPGLEWLGSSGLAVATKGAVESLLQVCREEAGPGGPRPLGKLERARIEASAGRLAAEGRRVLGVAVRAMEELPSERPSAAALERGMIFLGLVSLSDPPRPEAAAAVARCRRAGIRPVLITGDHPLTALAVAKALGFDAGSALTGPQLELMDDSELTGRVAETSVYARVAPEHKLKIVRALRRRGEIVAMTGDGVNDAPALREADIGVAMGITGTDVSKEASDMVLLDDNFATIVAAVEEGRVIYDNIRRFVQYLLTTNSAEILVMLLAPLLGMPLPLLPLQILWINLVTDGPTSLTLALEPAERGTMRRRPRRPDEGILGGGLAGHAAGMAALMTVLTLAAGFWAWRAEDPGWRSLVFTTLALAQMANVLAIRAESRFSAGGRGNPWLIGAVAATVGLQVAALYVPALSGPLSTAPLRAGDLAAAAGLSAVVFLAEFALRQRRARRDRARA